MLLNRAVEVENVPGDCLEEVDNVPRFANVVAPYVGEHLPEGCQRLAHIDELPDEGEIDLHFLLVLAATILVSVVVGGQLQQIGLVGLDKVHQ